MRKIIVIMGMHLLDIKRDDLMLVDFHTHLLPNVDDGSQSVEESLEMLGMLRSQEVECIVATPHFYPEKMGLTEFLDKRAVAYQSILANQLSDLQILLGAEVAFFRGISQSTAIENLCIENTNLLLVEMPFREWKNSEHLEIQRLIGRGIAPILAHVERYHPYQRDYKIFNSIINLPVYLQINAGALIPGKTRRRIFEMMDNGFPVLLGTDCHNTTDRKPNMEKGRNIIMRRYGKEYLDLIDDTSKSLLYV